MRTGDKMESQPFECSFESFMKCLEWLTSANYFLK